MSAIIPKTSQQILTELEAQLELAYKELEVSLGTERARFGAAILGLTSSARAKIIEAHEFWEFGKRDKTTL